MKKNSFHSIGFKIIFFYILLSLINISFIISIIFENQTALISKNTELTSEKQLSAIIQSIKRFSTDMKNSSLFMVRGDNKEALNQIQKIIDMHSKEYMIFSEKGDIQYQSDKKMEAPESFIKDGLRSMTTSAFSGKDHFLRIDEEKRAIYCYIPLGAFQLGNSILLIKRDVSNINESLMNLYYQALYVIIIVLLFHVVFALILYRYIIHPVNLLADGAKRLAEGKLDTRISLPGRTDEFASLAAVFNRMAESLHENIETLSMEKNSATESAEKFQRMTTRDDLLGLYNRVYLIERIREELKNARSKKTGMGLLLIDPDTVSDIMQIYGHQTGDIILMEMANIIIRQCADTDVIARYGDLSVAVLSINATVQKVRELAEKIRIAVSESEVITPDGEFNISVCIGIAHVDASTISPAKGEPDLPALAEKALLKAKEKGKDSTEIIV